MSAFLTILATLSWVYVAYLIHDHTPWQGYIGVIASSASMTIGAIVSDSPR